jgi:hypothetical protein
MSIIVSKINIIFLIITIGNFFNIQMAYPASIISDDDNHSDIFDKGNIAEIFDFGSGIFAALLFALSLIAYRNLKTKRLLFVSGAFAIFAIRTIVSRLDLFMPEIESSLLEFLLAIMAFAALTLFFLAIVKRERIKTKTVPSSSVTDVD